MTVVTFTDPTPTSDAGRVLATIRANKGLPAWAIARTARMPLNRVWSALAYLRSRRKIHANRSEHVNPKTGVEALYKCWFPGAMAGRPQPVGLRCTAAIGYGRECGAPLRDALDAFGRVSWACEKCERRNQGLCRTCPRSLAPKAKFGPPRWYCDVCEQENRRTRAREAYREKHAVAPEAMRV